MTGTAFRFDVHELSSLSSDHAIAVLDTNGCVATWNDGARRILGYDEAGVVGTHYRAFFPPAARERDRPDQLLERARTNGRADDEGWRVHSDGSRIRVREVIAPVWASADGDGNGNWDEDEDEDNAMSIGDEPGTDDVELRGYGYVVHDRTAEYEREQALREETALTESVFAAQPDLLYAYDTDRNLFHWNDRFQEITGYEPDELEGMAPLEFIAPGDRERIGEAIDRILEAGERITAQAALLTKAGRQIPYEFNSARITDDGEVLGFTGVGRDVSERKARERELERLERLNAVVRRIDETMVTAETPAEIERAIVEEFAAADAFQFAAIGRLEPDAGADRRSWEPRSSAGIDPKADSTADDTDADSTVVGADADVDPTVVDAAADPDTEPIEYGGDGDVLASYVDPPPDASGSSPLETGGVHRYRNLLESEIVAWRRDARRRGYGSVAVVPITAGNRSFGVLVVGATEPQAFADREREVLQEFGGTIGHALNAMTVRRLLYENEVVALELESTDHGDACIDLSAQLDCRLALDHVLPLTDDLFVYYVTISDAAPDRIRAFVTADDAVENVRCIDVRNDDAERESQWELTIRRSTFGDLLASYGARLRSKVIDSGHATIVIEASPDAAVRDLLEALQSAYPETTLVSKRTVGQSVETSGDFRTRVETQLTDKQQTALEAAYYGGYFEWPTRSIDAGELADRLGIARQTFHQHLRVAQGKLLETYFERDI